MLRLTENPYPDKIGYHAGHQAFEDGANAQLIHACKMFREFLGDWNKAGLSSDWSKFDNKYFLTGYQERTYFERCFTAWLKHEGIEA
jgi:hypothetical protein